MANIPIINFNTGEVTPLIDTRGDVDKYAGACRTLKNMIPRIYGCAERRPGTEYIASSKDEDKLARVIPFQYSDTIAYVCEFGESYIRFYYDGATLTGNDATPTAWAAGTAYIVGEFVTYAAVVYRRLVAGTTASAPSADFTNWVVADLSATYPICETPSPYVESDLLQLQVRQKADVMWIVHPDYAPRKLTRTTAYSFDLSTIDFENGPFLPRNDLENEDGITITPSATTGNITLTASAAVFDSEHISSPGALFRIRHPRATTETSGSATAPGVIGAAIDVKGSFTFNTHGTWSATVKIQRNEDEEGWEVYRTYIADGDRNVQYTGIEDADNVQYRINVTAYTSGTIRADITVNNSIEDGICRITSFVSSTVVKATVLTSFASTDAAKRWWEGAWSAYRGYPSALAFFEERAVYAGTSYEPQNVWFSGSGAPEDFETGTNDNEPFTLTLASDEANQIRWAAALEALVLGTVGGEWRIRATAFDETLTPKNFNQRQQTTHGSKDIQPVPVGNAVLFVDYVGRKVREMTFSDENQKFVAPDLAALAEHITLTGITSMAYQRSPDNILWCTLDNGRLLSMVYERDQNVVAWAYHILGGTNPIVESVATIPGTNEDEVWLSVKRGLTGSAPVAWTEDRTTGQVTSGGVTKNIETVTKVRPKFHSFTEKKLIGPSSRRANITIDKPAATAEGDLLVAVITTDLDSGSSIVGSGWTEIQGTAGTDASTYTLYKQAGDSEPSEYTFYWGAAQSSYGHIIRITDHNTTSPIDISDISSGTSATPTCPAVTTTVNSCLVLRFFGADDGDITVDVGEPAGTTLITVDKSTGPLFLCSAGSAYLAQDTAGDSGTAAFALTASEQWNAGTIAIAPKSGDDLIITLTNHGISEDDTVTTNWLTGTYYAFDVTQNTLKLSTTIGYKRSIERMNQRVSVDLEDSRFLDSNLIYEGTASTITNITSADPGVVTTSSAHGWTTGDQIYISGVEGMTEVNDKYYTITVLTTTTFEIREYTGP